jgi:YD repeat-containing protein
VTEKPGNTHFGITTPARLTAVTETLTTQTRTITYTYDGLQRLTGATETPGTTYEYTYDLAGNRTEVRENGAPVANLSYTDANQVIGWSYDAAGNLLSDGTSTHSYDALNRLVAHDSASYAYNGDSVLVSDGTTTYAQDLAAPLSQVLSDGTANYLYGHERLRALDGPWYVGDALGSVRQTLDDAGAVLATTSGACPEQREGTRGARRRTP